MFKKVDHGAGRMSVRVVERDAKAKLLFDNCEKCRRFAYLSIAQWGHMLSPLFVCPACISEAIRIYGEWKDG